MCARVARLTRAAASEVVHVPEGTFPRSSIHRANGRAGMEEEVMKPTVTVALVLSAAASIASADVKLETVGGTVYATSIDGTRAVDRLVTADKSEVSIEVVSQNGL